ncbi:hypothetical protein GJ496_005084 [Pomphorhynchus laevis]|nr:hypothetical protein GJ496_005084 [Pomphorhynchus laevis]
MKSSSRQNDNRRPDRVKHYCPPAKLDDDPDDYSFMDMFVLIGFISITFSLLMRIKWVGWLAMICSVLNLGNPRLTTDFNQMATLFVLPVAALIRCYIENNRPLSLFS